MRTFVDGVVRQVTATERVADRRSEHPRRSQGVRQLSRCSTTIFAGGGWWWTRARQRLRSRPLPRYASWGRARSTVLLLMTDVQESALMRTTQTLNDDQILMTQRFPVLSAEPEHPAPSVSFCLEPSSPTPTCPRRRISRRGASTPAPHSRARGDRVAEHRDGAEVLDAVDAEGMPLGSVR